jgi:DNA-binding NarL/FixJ family response regulator
MSIRCVVADDHPAIVDAVTRYLEQEDGVELVGTADGGARALELIETRKPDVALLDVRMPGLGGVEIARRLCAAGSNVCVILYTAHAEQALLLEALDAGARGFLLKEAPLADLARAIRLVSSGGVYIDPALAGLLAGPDVADRLPRLTKREREILRLLADGKDNADIGRELYISPSTVKNHISAILAKLGVHNRIQAAVYAVRRGLV